METKRVFMLLYYGHYNLFIFFSAGIDFRRQILTSEERAEGANCAQTGNHLLKQRRKKQHRDLETLCFFVC